MPKLASVLEHGLEREQTHYKGFWRSRPRHTYMGERKFIERLICSEREAREREMPYHLIRIETAKLDRRKINPDEDHFMTHNFDGDYNSIAGKHVCSHFKREFPPTKWLTEWAEYFGITLPSLGEWADAVGLGRNPAEARYSAVKGSLAYEGVVSPSALSVVSY